MAKGKFIYLIKNAGKLHNIHSYTGFIQFFCKIFKKNAFNYLIFTFCCAILLQIKNRAFDFKSKWKVKSMFMNNLMAVNISSTFEFQTFMSDIDFICE